jgi:hypothetical protein
MIRIHATPIIARDLQPGDLFSTVGPEYWDDFPSFPSMGERVYIRTAASSAQVPDKDADLFRIEIITETI